MQITLDKQHRIVYTMYNLYGSHLLTERSKTMKTAVRKWGNSCGVILPKHILNSLQWSENEPVSIEVRDNAIVIERARPAKPLTLAELFGDWNGDYKADEIDWGEPQGDEIW